MQPRNAIIKESKENNNKKGLELPDYKKQQYQHSFFVNTVIHRNHLPNSVVHANSLEAFKTALRNHRQWRSLYPLYKNHSWVLQRTRYRYRKNPIKSY